MKRLLRALLLIAASVAVAASAQADDDGGGRSLFADGAGNRALALGGSYAAVSDDASGVVWNPAGLGWLERNELQAAHTNLIGLGFTEQYASLAVPSWRYGVSALTLRRFGVDGVEHRDERNFLLDDDLSDAQTEVALGYGRSLSPAWSVGAAVKLRRQSLAGYGDSGFGLDLGVQVRPLLAAGSQGARAGEWTVGVAVRNAVEPSLRLDQEAVPDPTGVRVGTALRHGIGQQHWVLGTVDVEKTRQMDTALHAGLELGILQVLALRLGTDRGDMTAGMGITWGDYGFDYLFEDRPGESIHRFGVRLRFGADVETRRQTHLAAEERALQERLAAEFERRNRARLADLLGQASAALADGDLAAAAEHVAMAKVIAPEDEQVRDLEVELLLGRATELEQQGDFAGALVALRQVLAAAPGQQRATAMQSRIRQASDQRAARTAAIRELLDQGLDDFTAGDLLSARDGFARVLELDPGDQEAANMAERTELAIQDKTGGLLDQVRALAQAGRIAEAQGRLTEAQALAPADPRLKTAAAYITRREREIDVAARQRSDEPDASSGAPVAAGQGQAGLSAQQRQELEDLYGRGLQAMDRGDAQQAVHYFELVWQVDAHYQQVSDYLKQHYLARGMEAFVAGQLEEAVAQWESAVRVAPNDQKAQGYLQRATDQIKRLERLSS